MYILFTGTVDNQSGLYKIISDGTNIKMINDFKDCFSPKWSPDGLKIFYLKGKSDPYEIFIMDSSGTNESKITNGNEFCISPDGSKICYVFFDQQETTWEIFNCNIDGSNSRKLTNTKNQKFRILWSPVNSDIVFTENDNWNGTYENIYRVNVDTGILDTLASGYELPQVSNWSKDGNYILFGGNHAEVFKINLSTKEISQLTNAFMRDERACFSPDGSKILFESGRENKTQVYMMNSDGSNQHSVSKYSIGSGFPQWSPDGSSISYVTAIDQFTPKIVIANSMGDNAQFLNSNLNSSELYFDWNTNKLK